MLRKWTIMAACVPLVAAPVPARAQTAAIAADSAARTPAEIAARGLIDTLNLAERDRSAFVGRGFGSRALQNESAESRLRWLNKIAIQTGGLEIVSWKPQGDRMVEAVVKSRRAKRFGKFVLFTSKTEPGKISDVFLMPARDPAKLKAEAYPPGPLSLSRMGSEIDKRAADLAAEDNFSGVVLVAKAGRIILKRAYGFADQEWRIPNRTDTAFHLASVGKMFTAAAILKLAANKQLSLDDPVAKWVPEYPHPEASKITLKHLLTHTGGIGDWDGRGFKRAMTGAEAAATMTAPLEFSPGERFSYSNAGFVILGAVIEKATGKPLAEALQELVFEPAGMKRTGLWPVTAIVPNRATGYFHTQDDPMGLGPRYSNEQFLGYVGDGSGGEYSTADDMFAFMSALADERLLGTKWTEEMLRPRVDFAGAPRPSKYGYGVNRGECHQHPTFGHEGGGPNSGVSSLAVRTVDTGWTIIVLSNYDPPAAGDLTESICEFVANR